MTLADNGDGTRRKDQKNSCLQGAPARTARHSREPCAGVEKVVQQDLNVSLCTPNFKLWAVAHPLTSYRKAGFSTLVRYRKVESSPFLA